MEHGIVLNVGLVADADHVDIPARSYVRPDTGALANHDVSDHLSALIDVSGSGNPGHDAAIGANHLRLRIDRNMRADDAARGHNTSAGVEKEEGAYRGGAATFFLKKRSHKDAGGGRARSIMCGTRIAMGTRDRGLGIGELAQR